MLEVIGEKWDKCLWLLATKSHNGLGWKEPYNWSSSKLCLARDTSHHTRLPQGVFFAYQCPNCIDSPSATRQLRYTYFCALVLWAEVIQEMTLLVCISLLSVMGSHMHCWKRNVHFPNAFQHRINRLIKSLQMVIKDSLLYFALTSITSTTFRTERLRTVSAQGGKY